MARQTVKILPRTVSVAGGRDEERRLEENTGAKTRETNIKTLPQATIVTGGRDKNAKTKHEMERRYNPQSREGGEVPS